MVQVCKGAAVPLAAPLYNGKVCNGRKSSVNLAVKLAHKKKSLCAYAIVILCFCDNVSQNALQICLKLVSKVASNSFQSCHKLVSKVVSNKFQSCLKIVSKVASN